MIKLLRKYAGLYLEMVKTCYAQAMNFRFNFLMYFVMEQLFYLSFFATSAIIFAQTRLIGDWDLNRFLLFAAFMLMIDWLHMTFVSENFWEFSWNIRTGNLDFLLLKPAGTLFSAFFRHVRPATLINGVTPIVFLVTYGVKTQLSLVAWLALPPLLLLGATLQVCVEILLAISMFWTVQGFGVNFLRMQLQQVAKYPDFIYTFGVRLFFSFVIPVLLVGSAPVKFLLDPTRPEAWRGLGFMILAIAVLIICIRLAWKRGLRRYDSASS